MSAELFSPHEVDDAREHLQEFGHVGMTGMIPPFDGEQVRLEAERMSHKPYPRDGGGEQVTIVKGREPGWREPAFSALLQNMYRAAEVLGRDLRPGHREEARRILLDMNPGSRGQPHYDQASTIGLGGVTNLIGRSALWFEDGTVYSLDEGEIVFHDHDRHLFHGGYTDHDSSRVGLVITKSSTDSKLVKARKAELAAAIEARPPVIPANVNLPRNS